MKPEDAEEYTQALGQVVAGGWRQIALGERLGVPKALKLSTEQWVNVRLGGYVKYSVGERQEAVKALAADGLSQRKIAGVLGVDRDTVGKDLGKRSGGKPATSKATRPGSQPTSGGKPATEPTPAPMELMTGLAVSQEARDAADREEQRQSRERERSDIRAARKARRAIVPARTNDYQIIHADLANADVADESVDCIICDPPYPLEFIGEYSKLSRFAARVLKPGGSCLAMAGQIYLPDVVNALASELTYHWTVAYRTPGGQAAQIWPRKVNVFWKPVFWFVNGEYDGEWVGDVITSDVNDNDKRFHEWGQSESGFARLVERFSKPGDLIVDPFVGGGTTAVVALGMGRRFIGIDKDADAVQTTLERIAQQAEETA